MRYLKIENYMILNLFSSSELRDEKSRDAPGTDRKQDKKAKKTRTLSDVLSRIKKEPVEMTDLTRELFEKKKDCEGDSTTAATSTVAKTTSSSDKATTPNSLSDRLEPTKSRDEEEYANRNGLATDSSAETSADAKDIKVEKDDER